MGGFFGFLKGFSHSGSRQVRRSSRPLTRLALEELESRLTPSASTDNQVINQYRIFLKRLPEPPALASWSNELESGRISVGQMAERILHSPEYAKRTVTEFYATLFGRLPDRPGLAGHVQALQSGVPTLQVTAALLGSKEYFAWQGNDNRAFVESLYTGVLGRPSDTIGMRGHRSALESGVSRSNVALAFLTSMENGRQEAGKAYQQILGRQGSASELESWARVMASKKDGYTTLWSSIAGSTEGRRVLGMVQRNTPTLAPANPFMGPPGTSTMHANAVSSNATTNPGPGSGSVTQISTPNNQNYNAVFPTILMGSDGLIVAVGTNLLNQTPYVYLLDPNTLAELATPMRLIRSSVSDLAGGIYSYLDNQDRLVLVDADGYLKRISHTQQSNGTWVLSVESSVSVGFPDVVGLVPDYHGRVWFATAQGTTTGAGAVVGYNDPTTGRTFSYTLPAGEQVANSISSSPTGVAVASTAALYLFKAGAEGPVLLWRKAYDNGPARKPGQLSWGTGATPVFFGPTTGFDYLTITDNASPQENILVYRAIDGKLIGSVPFLTAGVNSGNEDAAIAVGNSIYYPSTYGYAYPPSAATGPSVPSTAPFVGGMQRVDVLPNGSGLTSIWANQSLPSAAEPRLSLADNLIYTIGLNTSTGVYSLITIDPSNGNPLSSTNMGSSISDNPLQMVSMISPNGVLYQGTERGMVRFQAAAS